ncbi:hypothetical protein [Endozoicomonas montiporae]|uniref:hypothetical protein n=1 Tax=Endozoicomonas montiporae TaxID=1027273 RepID=UPI0005561EC2|nr:hypothetical protein [Endozoicomonas montiporae]
MSELHIANPRTIVGFLRRMAFVVAATAILVYFSRDFFVTALMSNLALNGTILFVFGVGTVLSFIYVFNLKDDVLVVAKLDEILFDSESDPDNPDEYPSEDDHSKEDHSDDSGDDHASDKSIPQKMHLMGPTVTLLKNNVASLGVIKLSAPATRALIDSLRDSLDEKTTFIRYFTDLLVFIGLLGTFLGLTITIGSIGGILSDLAGGLGGGSDIMETLIKLIKGLEGPLGGMSTAFGSSLMGLSTSLVLGIFLLTLDKAGNYFISAMENWLAEHTVERRAGAGQGAAPAMNTKQLEQIATQLSAIVSALGKVTTQSAGGDRHWEKLTTLLNNNHRELKDETSRLSATLLRAEQHIETSVELQSSQLAQSELQRQESEKLRQLFSSHTDASIEALGAVHESKHRLVQIVTSLLDEQKNQSRRSIKTAEQVTSLKSTITQKTDTSATELQGVSRQLQALSDKVEEEHQVRQTRQSRMEKMFITMTRAITEIKTKMKGG